MRLTTIGFLSALALMFSTTGWAQQTARPLQAGAPAANGTAAALPPGYMIGAGDVLSIVVWRDKDMSADVTVRPDGKISLPLINEIPAAGSTPEELRARVTEAAGKLVADPDVTVLVKEIRSRNVYITGNVAKPSTYPMNGEMTVLQLIAVAGGLQDWAKSDKILVVRTEGGKQHFFRFNYKAVVEQSRTADNIVLKPGDTVVVP
jgi:polysaccharide export outer membrane protein